MTQRIPLGRKEGLRLEFKGRDALDQPDSIARAVVAMLNKDGGDVWIGLQENNGIATDAQPIDDPERGARRLFDYLVDTVEPSPIDTEITLHQVPLEEGRGALLQVSVTKGARRPYAFLKHGGRHFVIRIGDRTRPMSREELFGSAENSIAGSGLKAAMEKVSQWRASEERSDSFWLALAPERKVEIDIQDRKLAELLQEPTLSGNRRSGWNFTTTIWEPQVKTDRLVSDPRELHRAEIRRDGSMAFQLPLDHLHWKGDERDIWPFALLEFPISAFRLARVVYKGLLSNNEKVVADMAMFGLSKWQLRPHSPGGLSRLYAPAKFLDATDLVWEKPLVFKAAEIESEPDRCGYRLVERVYEAFGFRRDAIPSEFDERAGRLILPE